jgi:hypothetical protein
MAYTTTELVTRSWYLSSIVARDEETVSGDQLNDGLTMLNTLLSFKTADQRMIPYYGFYNFNGVVGQEEYTIPGLVLPESLTFTIPDGGDVRYSTMQLVSRVQYFGSPRANKVNSLPFIYHVERELGGSKLYMYFRPDKEYPFALFGKFSLNSVVLGQDLSLTLDNFYIDYLRYALAEYMCQEYNITFQPQAQAKLRQYESTIFDLSPIDFATQKISCLQRRSGLNYAQINIGQAYTSP